MTYEEMNSVFTAAIDACGSASGNPKGSGQFSYCGAAWACSDASSNSNDNAQLIFAQAL